MTDGDRAWFLAHLGRRYRLRPAELSELPAGMAVAPGTSTVVARITADARMRHFVTAPPHRRRDTDRNCCDLLPPDAKGEIARARTLARSGTA